MKRLFRLSAAASALVLLFSLMACSDKASDSPSSGQEEPPAQVQTSSTKGYESTAYNLKFTPPEGYVMFSDAEMDAQNANAGGTKYEMISEHSNGFPHVMVIAEKSDAENAEEYLENLKSNFSSDTYTSTEIAEKEIAGRSFKTFSLTTADGITESFYAEKSGEEFLCIAVITFEGLGEEGEVLNAFSSVE